MKGFVHAGAEELRFTVPLPPLVGFCSSAGSFPKQR